MAGINREWSLFDEDAELYDRVRPGYPTQLYEDLVDAVGVGAGFSVLEVGCGTGQATVTLAERGRASWTASEDSSTAGTAAESSSAT